MTKAEKEILGKALSLWGRDTQINKLQEELLELALVINQMKCPTKDPIALLDNLYDELADVTVMMAQANMIFDKDRINATASQKIDRMNKKYLTNH